MLKPEKYATLFDIDKQLEHSKTLTYPQCLYLKNVVARLKADIPAEFALEDSQQDPIKTGKCSDQYLNAKLNRDENIRAAFKNLPPNALSDEGKLILFRNLVKAVIKKYEKGGPPVNAFELHIYEALKSGCRIPETTKQLRAIIFKP